MELTIFLGLISFILLMAVLGLLLSQQRSKNQSAPLQEFMGQLAQQQASQLQQTTNLVLQQLSQQRESQDRSSNLVHNRLDNATKAVTDMQGKLLQLEEANKRIVEIGHDITSLHKILQAPKLRGTLGEMWLEDLVKQIIPAGNYKMQYAFKSGEICDCVIFLRDGLILPIDAKFSLENFVRMIDAHEDQQAIHHKQFSQDIKKRIDEIARKYIVPHENTLEFAFMYVPAENVYYQAFIQDDHKAQLLNYAFEKQVIPVSPSSFYAYMQVIVLGLRGMEIEKSAKIIQKNLAGLQTEFAKFHENYEKVGSHLRHAQQSFDQTDKRLSGIEGKFFQITQSEQNLLESKETTITVNLDE